MDYINEYNVFMYNQSRAMQQHSLESYISECMILAEGTNIVPRIRALHEADNEKTIGGFFKKIWEFIKRIWAKFIDKMTRLMAGNKRWLDKNRAIILNNAFKYDSITIYNYPEGVKRMVNGAVPAFNYADIEKELDTDAKAYEFVAKKIRYNGYKYNEDDDNSFSQDMKEWFFGGAEQIEIPKAKVNLTDMFNYCYEYDKMKEAIQKDKTNLERTIENMNRIVVSKAAKTTADNDKTDKADDGTATANGGTTNNDTDNPKPDPNGTSPAAQQAAAAAGTTTDANNGNAQPTNGQAAQNASFVFSNVYNTYISEADKAEVNGDPDNDANKDTVVRKRSAGTGRYGSKDATAKANMSNVSGKSDSDDENNKNIANAASGEEAVEIQKRCTRYNNAASGVLAAKLSAAEQCYKDYMRIMIAHVDSYTGRRQTNDKMATAATDFSNGNNNNNQQAAQGQQQQDNGGAQQQQPAQNTGNNQQAAPAQGQQQTQQQGNK